MAVVIKVHDTGTPTNIVSFNSEMRGVRNVVKIALAVVVIENVGIVGEIRFEKVEMAVKIVVAHADAHASLLHSVLVDGDAARHAFFTKGAIMIVLEEETRRRLAGEVEIGPTVFVEIGRNNGHSVAATHG